MNKKKSKSSKTLKTCKECGEPFQDDQDGQYELCKNCLFIQEYKKSSAAIQPYTTKEESTK